MFPARTSRFRLERHTRSEPYEPATVEVVDQVDGIVGSIDRAGARDGGRAGRVVLSTTITVLGRKPITQGLVLVDRDENEWTVDAVSTRTVFGNCRTRCDVSRTVGAVTA